MRCAPSPASSSSVAPTSSAFAPASSRPVITSRIGGVPFSPGGTGGMGLTSTTSPEGYVALSLHPQLPLIAPSVIAPSTRLLNRLEAVPGVGPIEALTAIAVFADVHRFATAKHVAAYAGLVLTTYQSGAADRHGHITKCGAAELRTMLCEAAHHARRPSHPLDPYFSKLCVRRGYKIAMVTVAHRLCRLLYVPLRDGAEFEPARIAVEVGSVTAHITRWL